MAIRTAIIGFGTGGRVFHAPLIASDPRFEIVAIVTRDPGRASAAAEYASAEVIADPERVLSRNDLDLVVITSPNETHAALARRAIAARIPVVVDKPLGVSSAEARALVDEAEAAGVPLTVFQNRRWDGDFLTLRRQIDDGVLGEVHQFDSAFEWWAPQLTDRWKDTAIPEAGGGILFDLGPHLIDQALQLFGDVVEVHAELDRRRLGARSDDDSFLSLTHESGVRSRLWMSATAPANRPRFRVVGSQAVFTSHGLDPQEPQSIAGRRPLDPGFGVHDDGRTATIAGPHGEHDVPLLAGEHRAFYRVLGGALIGDGALPVNSLDAVRGLEIIETALGR
ncbi:Gfo/Idh/MocA family protein [Microbacterium marinilacus]|uniref:Gfo/Idh/MocA family oxidoreductase n=1 Tax=Microbacterium marinilacus TaxID=415209 RepID=A0ABP7BRJ6_9MICO|nr:Gfo/Idh/MocA family oxidoreductase [Microbacterium marinilacus]MBY0689254.1 Gfo/Idh/MocA family oxidoreductase [Microbacterium marinilacus]